MIKASNVWLRKISYKGRDTSVWCYTIDGKQVSCKTTSKEKAERVREAHLNELREQEIAEGKMTIKELSQLWLDAKRKKIKDKTHYEYTYLINHFNTSYGNFSINEVKTRDINKWIDSHEDWNNNSQSYALNTLGNMFNWGIKNEYCNINPCKNAEHPKQTPRGDEWLVEQEDYERMLPMLNHYIRDVVVCLYEIGARPFEIVGLLGKEVDLDNKIIHKIEHKMKNKGQIRDIIITDEMLPILTRLKKNRGNGILFTNSQGRPLRLDCLNAALRAVGRKLDYKGRLTGYSFRHTFGSDKLVDGVPIHLVAGAMGHKGVNTLTTSYAKILSRVNENRGAFEQRNKVQFTEPVVNDGTNN